MEQIIASQVAVIFLLIFVGMFCAKKGILTLAATKVYVNFLLVIVMPAVVVKQFIRPEAPQAQLIARLGLALLLALIFNGMATLMARLLIKKRQDDNRYQVERLGAAYANAAFMALPMLFAALGEIGVLYGVIFVAVFLVFTWTHAVYELTGPGSLNLKKLLLNPGILGVAVGLLLFFTAPTLPGVLTQSLDYIAALNTPLAMIITGVFLAGVDFRALVKEKRIYFSVLLKNLALPLCMVGIIALLKVHTWIPGADTVAVANIISASCPTAATVILMTSRLGGDSEHCASIVAMSTAFSLVSMPIMVYAINLVVQ